MTTEKGMSMVRFFAVAVLVLYASLAAAQSYPVKPMRLIIPYPPGGGTDFFARTLGAKLTESLGQQVVMDQRPGAGGVIGADAAAKAAPDGYTLLIGQTSNLAINPNLRKNLPYDPVKDFAPVSLIAGSPSVLVVHPSLPVRTVKDLVALAKAKPGEINYATAGNGTPGHLSAAYFTHIAKIDVVNVPYKGASPALMDLLAGNVAFYFTSPVAAQPLVKAGRLRQLAVTSGKRFPPLPDVPTIAEAGYPEIDLTSWWGLLTPAGVPREIVTRLNADTVKAMNAPEMKERLARQGAAVMTDTPEQFAAFIRTEIVKWGKMVQASGAKVE
jgi:tripartite-type tricarboxylate transporter receptor subunit TctC